MTDDNVDDEINLESLKALKQVFEVGSSARMQTAGLDLPPPC
jgi:hypothetical protein